MVYQLKRLIMELLVSIAKFNVAAARRATALHFQRNNINTKTEFVVSPHYIGNISDFHSEDLQTSLIE